MFTCSGCGAKINVPERDALERAKKAEANNADLIARYEAERAPLTARAAELEAALGTGRKAIVGPTYTAGWNAAILHAVDASDAAIKASTPSVGDDNSHQTTEQGELKMNFGQAVEEAKAGKKIARAGWNGKNMWVCYMPPVVIAEGIVNGRTKQFVSIGDLNVGGYMVMWTATGVWQPGWLAAQPDILADDWSVVS